MKLEHKETINGKLFELWPGAVKYMPKVEVVAKQIMPNTDKMIENLECVIEDKGC